jgi:hypothetical protein
MAVPQGTVQRRLTRLIGRVTDASQADRIVNRASRSAKLDRVVITNDRDGRPTIAE